MPAASPKVAAPRRRVEFQSRVTTGKEILPGVDNRSAIARRYRDISSQIIADQGGIDRCSEARVQLVRRFAAAAVLAEAMEADLANGKRIDIGEHSLLTSSMVRVAQRIGVNRRAREIVPTLESYLSAKADNEEDAG